MVNPTEAYAHPNTRQHGLQPVRKTALSKFAQNILVQNGDKHEICTLDLIPPSHQTFASL